MESEILTWDDMTKEIKIVKSGLNGVLINENVSKNAEFLKRMGPRPRRPMKPIR